MAPDTVLRDLSAAMARAGLSERPVVRLRLTSGHVEEGRLLRVGADRTEEVVVLGSPPHRVQPPEVAVYVRMRDVVSVGVFEADRFRDVLSRGELPPPVGRGAVPARRETTGDQRRSQRGGSMGLAERRAVERFKAEVFPEWRRQLDEAAGAAVHIDVAWDELAVDEFADRYADLFPKVYFHPLVRALAAVAVDDLGREALRTGLNRIVVRNSGQYASDTGFSFADGVLTMDHRPEMNVDHDDERAKWLQQLLEANL